MKRIALLTALVLLSAGWGFSNFNVSLESYDFVRHDGQPELAWKSIVEEELDFYQVWRKLGSEHQFQAVGPQIAARGGGASYSFVDIDLYKTGEMIEYELVAVSIDGEQQGFGKLQFDYTPTAVRRTWGSIKAMFQ